MITQAGHRIGGTKEEYEKELSGLKESDIARVGENIYRRDLNKEREMAGKWEGGRGTTESEAAFRKYVYQPTPKIETTQEVVDKLPDIEEKTRSQEIRQKQIDNAKTEAEKNIQELKQQQERQTQEEIKKEEAVVEEQEKKIDETVGKLEKEYEPFQKEYADKYNEQYNTEQVIQDYQDLAYTLSDLAQGVEEDIESAGGGMLASVGNLERSNIRAAYNSKVATTQAAMSALQGSVNMVYTHIDRGINQITNDRNNQINFLGMIKGMAETEKAESKKALITLSAEEKIQIDGQIKELENKNAEIEETKDYVQNLMVNNPMLVSKADILLTDSREEIFNKIKTYYKDNPTQVAGNFEYKTDENGNVTVFNKDTGETRNVVGYDPITGVKSDPSKIIKGYDFTSYATDEDWGGKVKAIMAGNGTIESAEQIENMIPSDSVLKGYGKEIYQLSEDVDLEVLVALLQHESGLGNSNIAKKNNNFGGITWNANFGEEMKGSPRPGSEGGNYVKFDSVEEGLKWEVALINNRKIKEVEESSEVKSYTDLVKSGDLTKKEALKEIGDDKKNELAKELSTIEDEKTVLSDFSQEAKDWAKSIQLGESKFSDISGNPELKSEVNSALRMLPPPEREVKNAEKMVKELEALRDHKGLNTAVGPDLIFGLSPARVPFTDTFGAKQDFLGQANKLVSKKALQSLIDSKKQGATFGALSDREMAILKSAATTLGTWEKTGLFFDKDKVKGYDIDEKSFKREIQRIIDEYKEVITEAKEMEETAGIKEDIKEGLNNGYSPAEILDYLDDADNNLKDKINQARSKGFSDDEILEYLKQ